MAEHTPFSFHCMVCFEEFHPNERYPVVLPCGHTYVCNACAERLDKCMECRTPLFTAAPRSSTGSSQPPGSPRSRSSWSSARSGGISSQHPPQDPPSSAPQAKKRLPLPKNVVLLSLIEATELASADVQIKLSESPSRTDINNNEPDPLVLHSMGSLVDADEDEEEKIKIGTSLAVGVAGTYAVAAREGLCIYPSRPSSSSSADASFAATDEDVDTLVRFFHLDQKTDEGMPEEGIDKKDPARLCFGDRVQIVSVDGGWAKLARGYGFVRADKKHLVKVGSSVDRACKLEAMLRTLSDRRKELRLEQSKVDNQFIHLMNDLQISLQNDEDLTVILADAFAAVPDQIVPTEEGDKREAVPPPPPPPDDGPFKPPRIEQQVVPMSSCGARFGCFASDVFDGVRVTRTPPAEQISESRSQPNLAQNATEDRGPEHPESPTALFPAASHPSPSAMRAGARAWREQHGRPARHGINFRTGMSGHMALLSTHAHAHEYLDDDPGSPNLLRTGSNADVKLPKMSSHSGLSIPAPKMTGGFLGSLKLPMLGSPPREQAQENREQEDQEQEDREQEEVPQSGSM